MNQTRTRTCTALVLMKNLRHKVSCLDVLCCGTLVAGGGRGGVLASRVSCHGSHVPCDRRCVTQVCELHHGMRLDWNRTCQRVCLPDIGSCSGAWRLSEHTLVLLCVTHGYRHSPDC